MRLLVVRGPQRVGPFDLRPGANVVGRGTDCAIVLPSRRVSRRHAVIQVEGERVVARDLESHNGLIDADGRRVAVVPMPPGSRVQVGDFLLMLEAPMAPVDDDLDLDEEEKSEISLDPEDTAESELPPPTGPFPSRTEVPSAAPGNGASPPPPPATPTATPRPELPRPAPRPSPDS
ncbi:MAG: FHA domain-containing protein, partial [Myxococcota bacterium]